MSKLHDELSDKANKLYYELVRAQLSNRATKAMYEEFRIAQEAALDESNRQQDALEAAERERIDAIIKARGTK